MSRALCDFLSEETLLVPLREGEWLILAPDHLLAETEGVEDEARDDGVIRDILGSLAAGLHRMVAEEWGGESHVAVGEPFCPEESLVHHTAMLRETVRLGREFHSGMRVHLPWLIHLERLLSSIPEAVRARFIEMVAVPAEVFEDPETAATLDAFFHMDGKFKQESGLDVRSFHDAVLVRILLLLYKATKRALTFLCRLCISNKIQVALRWG